VKVRMTERESIVDIDARAFAEARNPLERIPRSNHHPVAK